MLVGSSSWRALVGCWPAFISLCWCLCASSEILQPWKCSLATSTPTAAFGPRFSPNSGPWAAELGSTATSFSARTDATCGHTGSCRGPAVDVCYPGCWAQDRLTAGEAGAQSSRGGGGRGTAERASCRWACRACQHCSQERIWAHRQPRGPWLPACTPAPAGSPKGVLTAVEAGCDFFFNLCILVAQTKRTWHRVDSQ